MNYPKRLLILNRAQFGYHWPMYCYCKWARTDFQITYQGFDTGQPKLDADGVEVHYVPRSRSLVRRYLRFLGSCLAECGRNYDTILVRYFPGCSLLRLWHPRRRFVLDIRTGSIAANPWQRWWQDSLLRLESLGFRHITILSASLARKLGLVRAHLLPLGADPVEMPPKDFSALHLLYVGTFQGRRLEDTVTGFHRFYREMRHRVTMTYDLVGDGPRGERDRLQTWVKDHGLEGVVSLPGFVHHRELLHYYEKCNVGVSYVPRNRIYDCQPPTKTFEYLLAGLPVIATNTSENAAVVTEQNGLLIEDTPAAFYEALKKLVSIRDVYSSERIRTEALKYSWEVIVRSNLVPYLNSALSP
ncbi:MAG: glycosyltransferase [Planctomycetes bacterium]|nr:glycosyltransferase [Planctomycetota bacterium]